MKQIEELKSSELKLIQEETKELNLDKQKLSVLIEKMDVQCKASIFLKLNELKSSNQSLHEMTENYKNEISIYEKETRVLREAFDHLYFESPSKKQGDLEDQKEETQLNQNENENFHDEKMFTELDEIRRQKNQELHDTISEYQKLYKIFLIL